MSRQDKNRSQSQARRIQARAERRATNLEVQQVGQDFMDSRLQADAVPEDEPYRDANGTHLRAQKLSTHDI